MVKKNSNSNLNFQCSECEKQYPKWQGQCNTCNQWDTINEREHKSDNYLNSEYLNFEDSELIQLSEINDKDIDKDSYKIDWPELNRAIGGDFISGSIVLLAGMPGVGKSTLLMQLSSKLSEYGDVIYLCGEESIKQVTKKFGRLNIRNSKINLYEGMNLNDIIKMLIEMKPSSIFIDSIQSVYDPDTQGAPGSINQIINSTKKLILICKKLNILCLMSGHVTKTGDVAGPRILEHMVDVVLQLEYLNNRQERILSPIKNRFGPTFDIGLFTMNSEGFEDVTDPASLMIDEYNPSGVGSILVPVPSGQRLFFYEIQSLIAKSYSNYPKKIAEGIDNNRLLIITSVLNKIAKISVDNHDVIINVMKGQSIKNVSSDFGICLTILSSLYNIGFGENTMAIGEIALTGEIRNPPDIERILHEGVRLGMKKAYIGRLRNPIKNLPKELELVSFNNINTVSASLFK